MPTNTRLRLAGLWEGESPGGHIAGTSRGPGEDTVASPACQPSDRREEWDNASLNRRERWSPPAYGKYELHGMLVHPWILDIITISNSFTNVGICLMMHG